MSKKIFITIPWFLPAFRAGGPIQSVANLVKEYNNDTEYYIFCSDTDLNGAALENITTNEWTHYNACTKIWYAGPERISHMLNEQVEKIHPDVLYIIGLYDWHFNIVPLVFCKAPKKIISVRGMLHPGALSQKRFKKKWYLQLFRLLEFHHKVIFHATDEAEAGYIRQQFGSIAHINVAGNFPNRMEVLPVAAREAGKLRLVSIALISPMKNILLVLEALQQVHETIDYIIYGPVKDQEYYNLCKEKIKALPQNITVTLAGEAIPSQVSQILSQAHVFILPSKSENFGHAIYEALSAGRPVITSEHTPWNHLEEAHAGMNVTTDDGSALAEAIRYFANMNSLELSAWSSGAADYAARAVDLALLRKEYERMFADGSI